MIKNILLGIDGSEHAETATRYALWLARRLKAHIVGLHVIDIVSIEGSFFTTSPVPSGSSHTSTSPRR